MFCYDPNKWGRTVMPIVAKPEKGIAAGFALPLCHTASHRRLSSSLLSPLVRSASALSMKTTTGKAKTGEFGCCSETDLGSWDRTIPEKKTGAVPPRPELVATTAFCRLSLASEKGRRRSSIVESLFCSKDQKPSQRRGCPLRVSSPSLQALCSVSSPSPSPHLGISIVVLFRDLQMQRSSPSSFFAAAPSPEKETITIKIAKSREGSSLTGDLGRARELCLLEVGGPFG
ncbi:hypothetical protein MRB53_010138 [Persea americana]|uniref:Uncharacterized protein n=1 Tax=Persea americana TaxID=3435 RepID=A0ACC2LS64_PERAE|nr:hypothetical protein MRB53_010138 [Persea americana]